MPKKIKNFNLKIPKQVNLKSPLREPNVEYSFTFNPATQHTMIRELSERAYREIHSMLVVLKHIRKYNACKITLYPEVSSKGRWHWHGYIIITDVYNFYVRCVPTLENTGMYEIDDINDPEIWKLYISKDEKIMKPNLLAERLPYMICDDTELKYRDCTGKGA